jgi:hypothetical protein
MTTPEARLWANVVRLAVVAVGFGSIAWRRWQKRHTETLAQAWPSVDGRLHGGHVQPAGDRCVASFAYDYYIGEYRSGTYSREFSSQKDAEEFVSQLKGKRVPIRYNPAKPDQSVLEDGDVRQLFSPISA